MSDSETSSLGCEEDKLYCEQSAWNDVVPIAQADSVAPVVAIRYSDKFSDCHGYLRAVMKSGEKSPRVVALTKTCIDCNPANYTAWKYRRDAILATNASIEEELELIAQLCSRHPKNFQIWHHRGELLRALGCIANEKEVTAVALDEDAKNYHVWSHRKTMVANFDAFEGEREFALKHIEMDFRNNSAYNYLFFVIESSELKDKSIPECVSIQKVEVLRALTTLGRDEGNEAAHNYLLGHLLFPGTAAALLAEVGMEVVRGLVQLITTHPEATWPAGTLAEIYEAAIEHSIAPSSLLVTPEDHTKGAEGASFRSEANAIYTRLASQDPIRSKYWRSLHKEE